MRILFLAYDFPPSRHVGAIRSERVVRALAARSHFVDVIARREGPATYPEIPNTRIHRVVALPSVIRMAAKLRDRLKPRASGKPPLTREPVTVRSSPRMIRTLESILRLPDEESGFVFPALLRALSVDLQNVDLVYSSGPPHSSHLVAATLATLVPHLRWIAELRDPWADNVTMETGTPTSDAITRWLERSTLSRADSVVTVTDRILEELNRRLGSSFPRHALVAYNGIHETTAPPPRARRGEAIILYAGSCYHKRDPRPFLEAAAQFLEKRPLTAPRLRVQFLGGCRSYNGQSLPEVVRTLGLEQSVDFLDWLPPSEARSRMANADLLLLLAKDQPAQVPNKLYDYLGARRPIIAVVDTDGESARILRQVTGHYLLSSNSTPDFLECLNAIFRDETLPTFTGSEKVLSRLTVRNQLARLVGHIEAVVREEG